MFLQDLLSKLVPAPSDGLDEDAAIPRQPRKKSRRRQGQSTQFTPSAPSSTVKGERFYRDKLAMLLSGRVEVTTPAGRIDILTATEVIEVKSVDQWKAALGQVRVYGQHYPLHRKRIHLFGHMTRKKLLQIQQHCFREGVVVTWEAE
jgi:hypothetical protein